MVLLLLFLRPMGEMVLKGGRGMTAGVPRYSPPSVQEQKIRPNTNVRPIGKSIPQRAAQRIVLLVNMLSTPANKSVHDTDVRLRGFELCRLFDM